MTEPIQPGPDDRPLPGLTRTRKPRNASASRRLYGYLTEHPGVAFKTTELNVLVGLEGAAASSLHHMASHPDRWPGIQKVALATYRYDPPGGRSLPAGPPEGTGTRPADPPSTPAATDDPVLVEGDLIMVKVLAVSTDGQLVVQNTEGPGIFMLRALG